MIIIFLVAQLPLAASKRNLTLTANSTGDSFSIWNTSLKTVDNCEGFHTTDLRSYFFIWPEDQPEFHYCCQANGTSGAGPKYTATNEFINPKGLGVSPENTGVNDLQQQVMVVSNLASRRLPVRTPSYPLPRIWSHSNDLCPRVLIDQVCHYTK